MTHSHPAEDELHDAVVCARCGHPIWDKRVSDTCATCAGHDHTVANSLFLLNDFTATMPASERD
jgi:hypothetical protein